MSEDFAETVRAGFTDRFGADPETAAAAAETATAFRDEVVEDLTAEALIEAVADGDDSFAHRYDLAIGDLAAADEDCTDSRPYRLAGFDGLAADPDIGA